MDTRRKRLAMTQIHRCMLARRRALYSGSKWKRILRPDVLKIHVEDSESWPSKLELLAWHSRVLPLSFGHRTTMSLHNPLCVLHRWYWIFHSGREGGCVTDILFIINRLSYVPASSTSILFWNTTTTTLRERDGAVRERAAFREERATGFSLEIYFQMVCNAPVFWCRYETPSLVSLLKY